MILARTVLPRIENVSNINESRNIDVAAIILSLNDVNGKLDEIDATGYGIPVLLLRKIKNVYPQNICPYFWCL